MKYTTNNICAKRKVATQAAEAPQQSQPEKVGRRRKATEVRAFCYIRRPPPPALLRKMTGLAISFLGGQCAPGGDQSGLVGRKRMACEGYA